MIIIPAIDLRGGKCVRLTQGKADQEVVYSEDPAAMARRWAGEGAKLLHVVDLDGAFQGKPVHTEVIGKIVEAAGVPVEVGGGLRTDEDIERTLAAGVSRVILGTRAWSEPDELRRLIGKYADRLAVGIDARDGWVQVKGWMEITDETADSLARAADDMGVSRVIYTDTAQDGMLGGVNTKNVSAVCAAVKCPVVAAGGVSSVDDVRALQALGRANLVGAIVGKALYEERVRLADLLAAAGEQNTE